MKSQNIKIPTTANIAQLMVRSVENAAKRTTLNPFARQARKSRKGTPSVDYDSDDFCDIKVVTLVPINTVDSKNSRHVYATMNIVGENMMPVRFQLDSGETCNIITTHALTELGIRDLTKTKTSTENVQ